MANQNNTAARQLKSRGSEEDGTIGDDVDCDPLPLDFALKGDFAPPPPPPLPTHQDSFPNLGGYDVPANTSPLPYQAAFPSEQQPEQPRYQRGAPNFSIGGLEAPRQSDRRRPSFRVRRAREEERLVGTMTWNPNFDIPPERLRMPEPRGHGDQALAPMGWDSHGHGSLNQNGGVSREHLWGHSYEAAANLDPDQGIESSFKRYV